MISAQTLRVCREGKPVSTFPDHALVVVDQHPSKGRQPDDDGGRDERGVAADGTGSSI
jgi:hypothetical protein